MIIRIHDAACCELPDSQLPDVVQLLGKDSFTFTLDQAQNHLNLVLPVNDYQVILETDDDRLAVMLVHIMSRLKQAYFQQVYTLHTDSDRSRMMKRIQQERPIVWITFDMEPNSDEWVVQYSLNQKKSSKYLAEHIHQHLAAHVPIHIHSEQIKWKQMVNTFRSQLEKHIPVVKITCGSIQALSVDHIEEIAEGIAKAVISVYTDKPILELIQALLVLEERTSESSTILSADVENKIDPINLEQDQVGYMNIQEQQTIRPQKRMSSSTSTFCTLRAHAAGQETIEAAQSTPSSPSFMSYMNQMSLSNRGEQQQKQPYNFMLHQLSLKKSVHDK